LRVADPPDGDWTVNDWVKKAVILYFPTSSMQTLEAGPLEFHDKMELKRGYASSACAWCRMPWPGTAAYLAPGTILMPSYVNIGAYVDEGTMVDTWATVGSCAQIGKHVHLSGGVGIGGCWNPCRPHR
jgi:2,3,4,5-tetrahydropyridine-2-carboxylate N-succinyltransferase